MTTPTKTVPVPGQFVAFEHLGVPYHGRIGFKGENIQLEDTSYVGVDEVTNLRPTIPVPVDVLRVFLRHYSSSTDNGWYTCNHCNGHYLGGKCNADEGAHTPTCPIPALREAVEESEKSSLSNTEFITRAQLIRLVRLDDAGSVLPSLLRVDSELYNTRLTKRELELLWRLRL